MATATEDFPIGEHDRGGRGDSVTNARGGRVASGWVSRPQKRTEVTVAEVKAGKVRGK